MFNRKPKMQQAIGSVKARLTRRTRFTWIQYRCEPLHTLLVPEFRSSRLQFPEVFEVSKIIRAFDNVLRAILSLYRHINSKSSQLFDA